MKCLGRTTRAALGAFVLTFALTPAALRAQSSSENSKPSAQPPGASPNDKDKLARDLRDEMQRLASEIKNHQGDIEAEARKLAADASQLADDISSRVSRALPQRFGPFEESGSYLGVSIDEVTPDRAKDLKLKEARGVVVESVEANSPAAKAGLRQNDVITRYGDQAVEGTTQFRRLVRETPAGRTVALTVWRDGKSLTLSSEPAESRTPGEWHAVFHMPDVEFFDGETPSLGIRAEDLTSQLGAYFSAPDGRGVLIQEVRRGTAAEKAGLHAGDVIVQANGQPVRDLEELHAQLRARMPEKSIDLRVLRKGSEMNVTVALDPPRPPQPPQFESLR